DTIIEVGQAIQRSLANLEIERPLQNAGEIIANAEESGGEANKRIAKAILPQRRKCKKRKLWK
ncbi:unnamed protein product, partial [Ilex paraguariensis]